MKRAKKGFKVRSDEPRYGESFKMKGVTLNLFDLKISSQDTAGELAVFEQKGFTPAGGPPMHIHPFQDEYFHIIEGEYIFQVGDDRFRMRPGDTIFMPREVMHAFIQISDRGKAIVTYMPAGRIEEFYKTTDSWTFPPTPKEIIKAFEDHDMKVVGPMLKPD